MSIVRPSLETLKKVESRLKSIPFWLNADILPGPASSPSKSSSMLPLEAGKFVKVCRQYFGEATLSLGWTTTGPCPNDRRASYQDAHIEQMINVIEQNDLKVR